VNLQDYILSGIIESHVLGLASPEESAEFERMCDAHSEVRAARQAFEIQLETSIQREKLNPPRELKSRIFSEIGMEKDAQSEKIPFRKPVLIPRIGFAKYVAAASLVLLAAVLALIFIY
jgi:hypothetical protein